MNQRKAQPASYQQNQEDSKNGQQAQLNTVAEKALPKKCKPESLAYCPTMDLVALATDDEELHVFRLNGQRVLGVNFAVDDAFDYGYGASGDDEEKKGEVRCMAWKRNGKFPFE
jgi:anaphase-promoting complex subunit 4